MKHKTLNNNNRRHTYKQAVRHAQAYTPPVRGWRVVVSGVNGILMRSPVVASYMDACIIAESLRGMMGGRISFECQD